MLDISVRRDRTRRDHALIELEVLPMAFQKVLVFLTLVWVGLDEGNLMVQDAEALVFVHVELVLACRL